MKKIFWLLLVFTIHLSHANEIADRVTQVGALIRSHPDSATALGINLLNDALEAGDEFGIVKSNFILAFIQDEVYRDYGKAIIYYLEAIRYAEKSSYPTINNDLISLNKNCGVIFRKFKAFELAEEYYNKALSVAYLSDNQKEINSISYNMSGLLMDQKLYDETVSILKPLIAKTDIESRNYWKYNNRLGLALYESENYEEAVDAHSISLTYTGISEELRAFTLHNIGRCMLSVEKYDDAEAYFEEAISIKKNLEDQSYLFSSYCEMGTLKLRSNHLHESLSYFDMAESYIDQVEDVKSFELYNLKADAYFQLKEYQDAKKYEDLYSVHLNSYLSMKEEIQDSDRKYNMDLITKRYFDEVAKQERIASILFYSKLTSGSLLILLLLSVGYNWYQKVSIRRSIVKELVDLKILD